MKIIYSAHLKRRLKERQFPYDYPQRIYKQAELKLYDNFTNHHISILKLKYTGKTRSIAISYDIIKDIVEIITIHPISENDIEKRIRQKRWQKT